MKYNWELDNSVRDFEGRNIFKYVTKVGHRIFYVASLDTPIENFEFADKRVDEIINLEIRKDTK